MSQPRIEALIARLEKGRQKTHEFFSALTPEQWLQPVFSEPGWTFRDLLAHFVSAEEMFVALVRDVLLGGVGIPDGFDLNAFNADEQQRFVGQSPQELLAALDQARQRTIDWVRTLDESQLDIIGRHPTLGDVTLETTLLSIYGHQLLHMRELKARE